METTVSATEEVRDIPELRGYAERLKEALTASDGEATIIALHGELGAGKTALVQELARVLGIGEQVTSPTFVIMKFYETGRKDFRRLIHIDAYRVDDLAELRPLHLDEVFTRPRTLVCVEWAEKLGDALPLGAIHLSLVAGTDGVRTITYGKNDKN